MELWSDLPPPGRPIFYWAFTLPAESLSFPAIVRRFGERTERRRKGNCYRACRGRAIVGKTELSAHALPSKLVSPRLSPRAAQSYEIHRPGRDFAGDRTPAGIGAGRSDARSLHARQRRSHQPGSAGDHSACRSSRGPAGRGRQRGQHARARSTPRSPAAAWSAQDAAGSELRQLLDQSASRANWSWPKRAADHGQGTDRRAGRHASSQPVAAGRQRIAPSAGCTRPRRS